MTNSKKEVREVTAARVQVEGSRVRVDCNVRGYLTAFLDLLGVSNELESLDQSVLRGNVSADVTGRFSIILVALDQFRSSFLKFYAAPRAYPMLGVPPALATPEVTRSILSMRPPDPVIHTFTDSVVVSVHLDGKNLPSMYNALHQMVIGCAAATVTMLGLGIPVRGGVSVGYGVELESGEVIGAGLVKAHRLESTVAVVPRVLIDPIVFTDFQPPALRPDASVEQQYAATIWEDTLTYLSRDTDGHVFVDFLNPSVVAASEASDLTARRIAVLDKNIADNLRPSASNGAANTQSVRAKWEWLDTYWKKNRALLLACQGAGKETP